jgi:peptidoglycan/LPS O-acetylase OafA/YrhL
VPTLDTFSHPSYRPDIDGLRAVSVLSAVAFHAFPDWVKGGFIGVDVFFVISGYLISTIIFENLAKGTFSFATFYSRRVKRIFPSLLLVLATSLLLGWFVLLADEYKQLGKHVAGGASFISNLVLWRESGYFDTAAETKPLLHLWSLGVEEQFYIIYPLALALAWKFRLNLLVLTLLIAGASFALNLIVIGEDRVAAFYSPQTRFWELMCGSLLAWVTLRREGSSPWNRPIIRHAASWIGLLLLSYGLSRIDKSLSFPGAWAVIPVLATVLLILSGPQAWINKNILSNPVAVWFGLISYPLYLWHWVLLSFARIIESETPNPGIRSACIGLSVPLAWITYRYVERPIRQGESNGLKVFALVSVMASAFLAGLFIYRQDGFPARQSLKWSEVQRMRANSPDNHQQCMNLYGLKGPIRFCHLSDVSQPSIALIGDSHATVLFEGLSELLAKEGQGLLNVGGRLFLDVQTYPPGNKDEIENYQGGIRATEFVAKEDSISTVIVVSRGPFYLSGTWIFKLISNPDISDREEVWEIAMRQTLDSMVSKGKKIVFVLDNPELDFDPAKCFTRPFRLTRQDPDACSTSRARYDTEHGAYRALIFRILKDYPDVKVFDSAAYLCDEQRCRGKSEGRVLYADSNHLSTEGSRYLAKELLQVIRGEPSRMLDQR